MFKRIKHQKSTFFKLRSKSGKVVNAIEVAQVLDQLYFLILVKLSLMK